ncbi:hypothetical protein DdX_22264 [Ditylenchus destructor]|uniref:Uncharacterized protein n=1 Tax=Ditylenchus destructor TaxID=166010 RepID=A0AAD4QUY1_9BILA|nr:hypothetical protein DdX_22264 [Ditylenchus destructor]
MFASYVPRLCHDRRRRAARHGGFSPSRGREKGAGTAEPAAGSGESSGFFRGERSRDRRPRQGCGIGPAGRLATGAAQGVDDAGAAADRAGIDPGRLGARWKSSRAPSSSSASRSARTARPRRVEAIPTGNSAIDYVRPGGSGPDRLLMNAGQVGRRGRGWWRAILDQYGANDVLIPTVELRRSYPGGPIVGVFTAGHGPDNVRLAQFVLRVNDGNPPARADRCRHPADRPGLSGRAAVGAGAYRPSARYPAAPARDPGPGDGRGSAIEPTDCRWRRPELPPTVQFDTPSVAALNGGESAMRGVPGVTSATTTSMALGGISVMRVTFEGSQAALSAGGFARAAGRSRKGAGGAANPAGWRRAGARDPGSAAACREQHGRMSQLSLPLDRPAGAREDSFLVGEGNSRAVHILELLGDLAGMAAIITGPRKSGAACWRGRWRCAGGGKDDRRGRPPERDDAVPSPERGAGGPPAAVPGRGRRPARLAGAAARSALAAQRQPDRADRAARRPVGGRYPAAAARPSRDRRKSRCSGLGAAPDRTGLPDDPAHAGGAGGGCQPPPQPALVDRGGEVHTLSVRASQGAGRATLTRNHVEPRATQA